MTQRPRGGGEELQLHVEERGGRDDAGLDQHLPAPDGRGLDARQVHGGALAGQGAGGAAAVHLHGADPQRRAVRRGRQERGGVAPRRPARRGWCR